MAGATRPEEFWRSLFYFNLYRLVVACGVVVITWIFRDTQFGSHSPRLFFFAALAYILFSGFSLLLISMRRPRFNWQLAIQVGGDVMFLAVLTYASGGVQSGLGLLLLASLAAAGLVSRGKLALFFASVASIGMLLEETYAFLYVEDYHAQYLQAGLLSMGYFAVAWLAHQLAKYALVSEQLALQRGIDLANMAQVNQLVIQDMQDGVLVVDEDGKIRQRNFQAEKLIGLAPGISATPMLAKYAPVLAARLKLWHENASADFDLLRIPASNALVRTRFVPVKGKGKGSNRAGAVIFLEDMGRVQAQAQQMKLAALGRLTANIAHEIRNPLSAISHAAELLAEEPNLSPTHPRLLQIIRDNTQRLNRMVQDVLQLNRRDRSMPETFPAADFLRTFIADFCHAERIDVETFVLDAADQQVVHFDRGHLNQVLWNLCHNAWRHCRKQRGSIRLQISRRTGGAGTAENSLNLNFNLDVIDDGPGVAPAVHGQLFEPFFTTAASGTGLGLYIAREMCEANGATLDCLEDTTGGYFRIVCRSNPNHGQA